MKLQHPKPSMWAMPILTLALALVSVGAPAEDSVAGERLTNVVRRTFIHKWEANLSPEEKAGRLSAHSEPVSSWLNKATNQTVDCWSILAKDFDREDRELFADLLSQYEDAFVVPDWEQQLSAAIDEKYGPGAAASRKDCSSSRQFGSECSVAKSYKVVGGLLFAILAKCAWDAAQEFSSNARP